MKWWWLSFADPTKPKGQQNLGVSVVRAFSLEAAVQRAWDLGCNPGGQIMAYEVAGPFDGERALTPEELAKFGEKTTPAAELRRRAH